MTDPIADMLTRLRNGAQARHPFVLVPSSRMKVAIARILKEEGFIKDYEVVKDQNQRLLRIWLKYDANRLPVLTGLERVSKPGLRIYKGKNELPRVLGGLGIAIVSTSKGIMTERKARRLGVGGEVICRVW
jgi:small subunit ribosomal protein S8